MEAKNIFVIIAAVLLMGLLIAGSYYEQKQWQQFSAQHNCRLIGHQDGRVVPSWTGKHMGTTYIPATNTYHCDDGVDYTK